MCPISPHGNSSIRGENMNCSMVQSNVHYIKTTLSADNNICNNHRSNPQGRGISPLPGPKNLLDGRWSPEEHELFLKGLKIYKRNWKKFATFIRTRTAVQIRTHAQKYFNKLEKDNHEFTFRVKRSWDETEHNMDEIANKRQALFLCTQSTPIYGTSLFMKKQNRPIFAPTFATMAFYPLAIFMGFRVEICDEDEITDSTDTESNLLTSYDSNSTLSENTQNSVINYPNKYVEYNSRGPNSEYNTNIPPSNVGYIDTQSISHSFHEQQDIIHNRSFDFDFGLYCDDQDMIPIFEEGDDIFLKLLFDD
eukprot:gene8891-18405_t